MHNPTASRHATKNIVNRKRMLTKSRNSLVDGIASDGNILVKKRYPLHSRRPISDKVGNSRIRGHVDRRRLGARRHCRYCRLCRPSVVPVVVTELKAERVLVLLHGMRASCCGNIPSEDRLCPYSIMHITAT